MTLVIILSASVTAFASSGGTYVDGAIVDTLTNVYFDSYNCSLVYAGGQEPSPNMTGFPVGNITQKTTYRVLYELYERCTVYGSNLVANKVSGTYDWIERNGYCFIVFYTDNPSIPYGRLWVGNFNAKILYCDAPASETTYTISAIAGATGYCITDRPAGTTGNGYLGDLLVTQDNLTTIHGVVSNLGGVADYYTVLRIVNGEYRYYIMCTYPNRQQYFVCNTSGQLFYALRDEVTDDGGDTGGGSTFDPTEVITAINSVYSAINSMNSNLGSRLANILNSVNGISISVENLASNVVTGFTGVQEQLTTLNGYFSDLSGLFPVQEEITLLGSDTRVAWDSADRITGVKTSGFNTGDLTVKTNPGPLIDESGYQNVKLSPGTTEYTLSTDDSGYRRITADNEYPVLGSPIPDSALYYYTFDNTLAPTIGDLTFNLNTGGTALYGAGVNGQAFKFNGATAINTYKGSALSAENGNFTLSFWFKLSAYPDNYDASLIKIDFGDDGATPKNFITLSVQKTGRLTVQLRSPTLNYAPTTDDAIALNTWTNIAITCDGTNFYVFLNGDLQITYGVTSFIRLDSTIIFSEGIFVKNNSMLDELILVDGDCLWSASFNASNEAIFSEIAADYFLPCTDQTIGLVFDDTINKTLSPTDVNGNAITMGRLEDDFSEIYMDISTMQWYCHDPQTQTEILLSSANQQIMNDTIYVRQNYTMIPADQITADALQNLLPVDAPVYLDMPEGAKLTITYDHYSGWFRAMYILMDKQNQLLNDLDIVNETIINVENTVVDITQDNDAYNIFYITKTDGTTESVGDAAKDAAVFVGDILSMFYRLVFEDALDSADILNDFESAYSNTEVVVW